MNANMVYRILSEMSEELSTNQMKRLQEVLFSEMENAHEQEKPRDNLDIIDLGPKQLRFISEKGLILYILQYLEVLL